MKVLQVVSSLDGSGGVQRLLMNYYMHINQEKIRFDFMVYGSDIGELETKFKEMGSEIFHIVSKRKSLLKCLIQMNQVIEGGAYDVIHVHQDVMSIFPIFFAKKAKIKKRIAHGHLAFKKSNIFRKCIDKVFIYFLKRWATDWWACSNDAAEALWGKTAVKKNKVYIMKNAIDIEAFRFKREVREEVRSTLMIEDHFVIGCIGRFTYQKNYQMLVRIFNEIHKIKEKSVLVLIGKGELEESIREQIDLLGLSKAVKFLGVRNDINILLQAMDVFILPSRYEGLGIVYIEAQAAGLLCFGTKEGVPKEAKVTNFMNFISGTESVQYWAQEAIEYYEKNKDTCKRDEKDIIKKISDAGYCIQKEARKLEIKYGGV